MQKITLLEGYLDTYQNRFRRTDPLDLKIVGVDDGAFSPTKTIGERALLLAVLFRRSHIQKIRMSTVEVDGTDAKTILKSLVRKLRYDLIMLSGISFAGFNIIDISELTHDLQKPVIVISGEKPDNRAVRKALKDHFVDWRSRWDDVRSAGKLYACKPLKDEPKLYFEVKGATPDFARRVISRTAVISRLPEPIRVARILAKGLSLLTATMHS
jgi:endonuclease V-like protein UPF0215 family